MLSLHSLFRFRHALIAVPIYQQPIGASLFDDALDSAHDNTLLEPLIAPVAPGKHHAADYFQIVL